MNGIGWVVSAVTAEVSIDEILASESCQDKDDLDDVDTSGVGDDDPAVHEVDEQQLTCQTIDASMLKAVLGDLVEAFAHETLAIDSNK